VFTISPGEFTVAVTEPTASVRYSVLTLLAVSPTSWPFTES
jgi:hypothetical protein